MAPLTIQAPEPTLIDGGANGANHCIIDHCMIPVVKSLADCKVYRISEHDTNRLAIIFDPNNAAASLTVCVEIFDPGGSTPFHRHQFGVEMFFILKGEGIVRCDGKEVSIRSGDSILVPPTGTHQLINTGAERLYALCFMVPNEDFVELIQSGIPVELDEEDLQVLQHTYS